jgi:hypothetical protein
MSVNITVPTPQTPGHPRRQYLAMRFYEKLNGKEMSSEGYVEMMRFMSSFLTDEEERKQSDKDIMASPIWELSEEQQNQILQAVMGGGSNEIPPQPQNPEPIATPLKEENLTTP